MGVPWLGNTSPRGSNEGPAMPQTRTSEKFPSSREAAVQRQVEKRKPESFAVKRPRLVPTPLGSLTPAPRSPVESRDCPWEKPPSRAQSFQKAGPHLTGLRTRNCDAEGNTTGNRSPSRAGCQDRAAGFTQPASSAPSRPCCPTPSVDGVQEPPAGRVPCLSRGPHAAAWS